MKSIVIKILSLLTKLTLWRYQPRIIGITGSVGKTSTKEAIRHVLDKKLKVRASLGNYNNELGVPLTVIGEKSGGKNIFKWLWIFTKAKAKFFFCAYPEVLILEMGTDRPGDIAYLLGVVKRLDAAVLTDIGISHLEFFGTVEQLAKEKLSIVKGLNQSGVAVLNFDNQKIFEEKDQSKGKIMGYGFHEQAEVKISDYQIIKNPDGQWGVNYKIHYKGTVVPFFLPNVVGLPVVYAFCAATAVGLSFGLNLVEISEKGKSFRLPSGRLHIIKGANSTTILDDSYNAAPASTMAALDALCEIASGRKLVVLGTMAELGSATEEGLRMVSEKIHASKIDLVFLVGDQREILKKNLFQIGFQGQIVDFITSTDAAEGVIKNLQAGDTILVKGSQSARMERVVKKIMADPKQADRLLVRQSVDWIDKP